MNKDWTGDLVGLMHNHRITNKKLAAHMGLTNRYISMVLNGHRQPPGAEDRFRRALDELISQQDHDTTCIVR